MTPQNAQTCEMPGKPNGRWSIGATSSLVCRHADHQTHRCRLSLKARVRATGCARALASWSGTWRDEVSERLPPRVAGLRLASSANESASHRRLRRGRAQTTVDCVTLGASVMRIPNTCFCEGLSLCFRVQYFLGASSHSIVPTLFARTETVLPKLENSSGVALSRSCTGEVLPQGGKKRPAGVRPSIAPRQH